MQTHTNIKMYMRSMDEKRSVVYASTKGLNSFGTPFVAVAFAVECR